MTLNGHYALCFKMHASFGAHHENLNEYRPIHYLRRRRGPMTVVSGNIRFVGIYSRGFPGEGSSNDNGVVENGKFQ